MRKILPMVLILLVAPVCGETADNETLVKARPIIERLIAESRAETVSVAVYDLQTAGTLFINERVRMHAASTMKVPVMMETFRLVKEKNLRLDDELEVKNQFFSIIDGSEFKLNKADDSDEEVYRRIGQKMTIADLLNHMITWSSNLATNLLIQRVTPEKVNLLMRQLGANDTEVLRGVEDSKAFRAGKNNQTTAYDLMLLFRLLAEKKFLNGKSCEMMIEILAGQNYNDGLPAGLPRGMRVAHKTGSITRINHDAGIVYVPGRKPYIIVVMVRGLEQEPRSSQLIADISRTVYQVLSAQS
jgi:beta-lactamase class A